MGLAPRLNPRGSGILLHPTSLPGPHGCGDIGPAAYRFIDFLAAAGQRWWQMLPVCPPGPGNAPYSATSAFAGSPWLVSPELLAQDGLLRPRDMRAAPAPGGSLARVNHAAAMRHRAALLRTAFDKFRRRGEHEHAAFQKFIVANDEWLADFALFRALKRRFNSAPWSQWRGSLRDRDADAVGDMQAALADEISYERFIQYQFDRQWAALRRYAREKRVSLIGDVPIFVAYESADVWARRELFLLDANGRPTVVSGCPPDPFNRNGQLWGHAHYRWPRHAAGGFAWWISRFQSAFRCFDAVRIDHFLGFHRVWAVPGGAKTARRGRWMRTPGRELFAALKRALGRGFAAAFNGAPAIIAEDLGAVTRQAVKLRDDFGFPGMRVMQFGFGGDNPGCLMHRPDQWPRHCVGYTGTHDNETTLGWFARIKRASQDSARLRGRAAGGSHNPLPWKGGAGGGSARRPPRRTEFDRAAAYFDVRRPDIHWTMLTGVMNSAADTVIFPMQDILGLGARARMNVPGVATGNWEWRMSPDAIDKQLTRRLREITRAARRHDSETR